MRATLVFVLFCVTFNKRVGAQTKRCGTLDFYGATGRISSPKYPGNYSNDLQCDYSIIRNSSNTVAITFQALDIRYYYDSIQIICVSGHWFNSPQYSGKQLPPVLTVQFCNRIIVRFTTHYKRNVANLGFSLDYEVLERAISGGFSIKPMNVFASVDSYASFNFNCTSNTGYIPSWSLVPTGWTNNMTLTQSSCLLSNSSRYTTWLLAETLGPGSCNLIISAPGNQLWNLAGVFVCSDSTLTSSFAILVPISLSSTISESLILSSADLARDDQLNISCILNVFISQHFYGVVSLLDDMPFYKLNVLEIYWSSDNGDIIAGNDTTNTSSFIIVKNPVEARPSYSCNYKVSLLAKRTNAATNFPAVISKHTYTQTRCRNFLPLIIGGVVLIIVLLVVIIILLGKRNLFKKKTIRNADHEQNRIVSNQYEMTN